jgi:hypothetical protein
MDENQLHVLALLGFVSTGVIIYEERQNRSPLSPAVAKALTILVAIWAIVGILIIYSLILLE